MPLELPYAEMERVIKEGYSCAECGGRLNIATYKGKLVLRCGNIEHSKITRHDKEYEERLGRYRMDSKALMTIGSKEMAKRVDMARFPQQLTSADKHVLVEAALSYGFDPLMNEISVFQGRPYVSFEGRYRKAQETGRLQGVNTIPATDEERKAWRIPEGDYFVKAEIKVRDAGTFIGWGRVLESETHGNINLPCVKWPQRMAEKRAEVQALKKAFSIPLPSVEFVGTREEADYIESTAKVIEEKTEDPPDPPATFNFGAVLAWCYSHGTQYNKTWFLEHCGMRESDIQDDLPKLEYAMSNICTLMNWDGIKRG